MIKTTYAGEDLTAALAKQQAWVDDHADGNLHALQDFKRARNQETDDLQAENRTLKRRLSMAKATLRSDTP